MGTTRSSAAVPGGSQVRFTSFWFGLMAFGFSRAVKSFTDEGIPAKANSQVRKTPMSLPAASIIGQVQALLWYLASMGTKARAKSSACTVPKSRVGSTQASTRKYFGPPEQREKPGKALVWFCQTSLEQLYSIYIFIYISYIYIYCIQSGQTSSFSSQHIHFLSHKCVATSDKCISNGFTLFVPDLLLGPALRRSNAPPPAT